MIDLKPCPFCGGEAHASETDHLEGGYVGKKITLSQVRCSYINCEIAPCIIDVSKPLEEAISVWNIRTVPEIGIEAMLAELLLVANHSRHKLDTPETIATWIENIIESGLVPKRE